MKRREIRKFQSYFAKLADCRRAGGVGSSGEHGVVSAAPREAASAERR